MSKLVSSRLVDFAFKKSNKREGKKLSRSGSKREIKCGAVNR